MLTAHQWLNCLKRSFNRLCRFNRRVASRYRWRYFRRWSRIGLHLLRDLRDLFRRRLAHRLRGFQHVSLLYRLLFLNRSMLLNRLLFLDRLYLLHRLDGLYRLFCLNDRLGFHRLRPL